MDWLYQFPFQYTIDTDAIDSGFRSFAVSADVVLSAIRNGLNSLLTLINDVLVFLPWWVYVIAVFFIGFQQSKKITTGAVYAVLLYFIGMVGLWDLMIPTLAIIIAAVTISVVFGFPIGVLISASDRANNIVRPILDTMQTMPIFVYLIPAVLLFGLGRVPGVMATVIYSIVPIIRLTNLGIRQVNEEVVEAAKAFGSTALQSMVKVQIPQAFPTIMAGVNQTLMMAMAMVVTTSMIGVAGLGLEVLISVNRIEVGRGLVSGTAVVIIAILLDRLSQGWVKNVEVEED
jgi:glycine betaine/proline transport system permease protein/glycine betaine/proline transport system substrate-binding protein